MKRLIASLALAGTLAGLPAVAEAAEPSVPPINGYKAIGPVRNGLVAMCKTPPRYNLLAKTKCVVARVRP